MNAADARRGLDEGANEEVGVISTIHGAGCDLPRLKGVRFDRWLSHLLALLQ